MKLDFNASLQPCRRFTTICSEGLNVGLGVDGAHISGPAINGHHPFRLELTTGAVRLVVALTETEADKLAETAREYVDNYRAARSRNNGQARI